MDNKNVWIIIFAVVISSLLTGISIFGWQNQQVKQLQRTVNNLQSQLDEVQSMKSQLDEKKVQFEKEKLELEKNGK